MPKYGHIEIQGTKAELTRASSEGAYAASTNLMEAASAHF